jgi:hypothetical protein
VINNAIVKNCYISNANSVKLRGGDYAKIEIKNIGYAPRIYFTSLRDTYPVQGSVIEYSPNNFYKVAVSSPAQIILANGWNWANVAWLISRVPNNQLDSDPTWSGSVYGSDPETWSLSLRGQLDLKLKLSPWVANAPSNSLLYSYSEPGVIDTRTLIRYPGNTSTFGSTYTYDGVEIAKLPSPMDSYDATRQRSRVIIGDPDDSTFQFGNTGTYDPFGTMFGNCRINCNYKYTGTQNSVRNSFIPWSLEFISGGRIQNIRNKGGIVKPHDDLPSDAVVRIGQIKMQNNATVILNNTNGNADIRVGLLQYAPGFSGSASGAYFQGGIVSADYTNNRIRGTNVISWGTGIDTGYNVRQSFAGEVNAPGATFTIQTNSV